MSGTGTAEPEHNAAVTRLRRPSETNEAFGDRRRPPVWMTFDGTGITTSTGIAHRADVPRPADL